MEGGEGVSLGHGGRTIQDAIFKMKGLRENERKGLRIERDGEGMLWPVSKFLIMNTV